MRQSSLHTTECLANIGLSDILELLRLVLTECLEMTILFRNVLKTVMEMCGNLSQLDQNWHGN